MRKPPRKQRFASTPFKTMLVSSVLVTGVQGCADRPAANVVAPQPDARRVVASLTGEIAVALDASGKFRLPKPPRQGPYDEIPEEQAVAMARAWARQYGGHHATFLQEMHGAPIDFQRISPCGRTLYARSSFQPPRPEIPAPSRRAFGPWWLVTMCSAAGTPQVSLAVSAWATDTRVENGKVVFPFHHGGEFFPLGIPIGHTGEYPTSPEMAATSIAEEMGRRIAAVPELVAPSPDNGPPQGARWILRLDRSGTVATAKSGSIQTERLFFGREDLRDRGGAVPFLASPEQPESVPFHWSTVPSRGESEDAFQARRQTMTDQASRRVDTPIRFDRVSIVGGR